MFGTSGIRGPVGKEITADLALKTGRALAVDADSVVIGRDPRETGKFLEAALSAGLRECGADVIRLGLASTPTIARAVAWQDADAGVSVTASHNPPPDNGVKLWQPSGQAFDENHRETMTDRIRADAFDPAPWDEIGSDYAWHRANERHVSAICRVVDSANLSIILDIGNGAGGVTADALIELGCSVETLNAQPDGRFPGRPSEPTADHCTSLRELVAASTADLGIAHDGDADRMLAVCEDGTWVPGDVLLALFARNAAASGDRVAVPVDTSLLVDDAVEDIGASVTRTRVGDVFVGARAAEPDAVFGGEPSGAWIWPDESLCPDGPLAAAKLASLVAEEGPLSTLVAGIDTYPIRRTNIETDDKAGVMDRVSDQIIATYETVDTLDGIRVDLTDGWFLVRASGTQPLVRITAEARDPDRADEVFATARAIVDSAVSRTT